jgi:hypothetical protein
MAGAASRGQQSRRNRGRAGPTVNLTYLGEFFGLSKIADLLNLLEKFLLAGTGRNSANALYGCSHLYILSIIGYT